MEDMNRPYDIKHHYYMYDIGWLIDKIQEVSDELDQAIDLRTIHYADPINWDITTQYQANTVVVDNKTGVAYISSQNVPAGVLLTNTTYWNPIFNYNDAINKLMSTIAYNEQDSPTATAAHAKNSFIYSNAVLYQAIRDIAEGDALKVGANIQLVTLSDSIIALITDAVSTEAGARAEADSNLSERITAEATTRAEADANYTGKNKVSNVTGNDTRTAENITDTANNIVIHGKESILLDSDGTYTETVSSTHELTVNGNDSVHIGGVRTEVYDSNKQDEVKGDHIINRNNITATINGKTNITAKDKISINTSASSLPIIFPDKKFDLYNLDNMSSDKRVMIALGDSLGSGIMAPSLRSTYGWLYKLRERANKNLTVYTNLDIIIEGNSGFAASAPFLTQLQLIVSQYNINPADVTDIVIFAGTNDCQFVNSTLEAALDEFFTYVKQTFINSDCLLGTLTAAYSTIFKTSPYLPSVYRKHAEKNGYRYTGDLYNLCLRKKFIQPDKIHLNDEGYKSIYPYIVECALNGFTNYFYTDKNIYTSAIAVHFDVLSNGIYTILGDPINGGALYIGNININDYLVQVLPAPETENILCNIPYTRICPVLVNIGGEFQMGDYYLTPDNEIHLALTTAPGHPEYSGSALLSSPSTGHFTPIEITE